MQNYQQQQYYLQQAGVMQQQVQQTAASQPQEEYYGEEEEDEEQMQNQGNALPVWGNPRTMNLNHLILSNIQQSPYFKVKLSDIKTYHEVVDEIYYKVEHMEPWEKGSRKTAGQTGMCGGVRGVGAGGIVSSCFCNLFKMFTIRLTRKQLKHMINHPDSPYIRGIGFMYIRFCQSPEELFNWFRDYLFDEEEIDVKAGGGYKITIGAMLKMFLTKLDWFSTLFPRIPVPIQKKINIEIRKVEDEHNQEIYAEQEAAAQEREQSRHKSEPKQTDDYRTEHRSSHHRSSQRRSPERKHKRSREHRHRSRSRERKHRSRSRDRRRSRSNERRRSSERNSKHSRSRRSRSRERKHDRERSDRKSHKSRR